MKRFAFVAGLVGVTLLGLLFAYTGLDDIAAAVASAGWAALLVVVARAAALVVAGLGWRVLFPPMARVTARLCVGLRFLREGVNQLLPVGQVGGDLVGARVATFYGVGGALAGATTIADVALQAVTQFLFALFGLAVLIALKGDTEIARYAAGGLGVAALALVAFFVLQARLGPRWIVRLLRRLAAGRDWSGLGLAEAIFAHLAEIYARPARVLRSVLVHMVGWFVGGIEVYVVLHFMGHPVTVAEALVIESLGQAVRGAAFAIPGGIGVQEGGYVALCGLFGIAAGPAVALSLVKRVPDLVLGLPALAAWQWIEGRRVLGADPPASSGLAGSGT